MPRIWSSGSSGGSSSSADVPWTPARKPTAPHAYDEEFESDLSAWTLAAGAVATAVNPYSAFSTAGEVRHSVNNYRPSWLVLQTANNNAYVNFATKPITAPANLLVYFRASFPIRTRSGSAAQNESSIGIRLSADSGGAPNGSSNVCLFFNQSDATHATEFFKNDSGTTVVGSQAVPLTGLPIEYGAIQKIGTTYHAWVGTNGGQWIHLNSTTFAPTVAHIVLSVGDAAAGPGNAVMGVDFIRFVESATFLP